MVFYSAQDSSPCVGTMAHKHETSHHSEAKSKTSPWWVQIRKADTIEVLISDFFLFCDVETTSSRAMLKFTETSSYHQDSPCLVFWLETSSFWSSNVHTVYVSRLWESPVCNECHLCFSYKIKDPGMCHGPANHIMQVLLIKKKKSRQEQHKGKVTSFGSQFQGREVKQAGARNGWTQTPTIRKQVESVNACSAWRSNVCCICIHGHTRDKMEMNVLCWHACYRYKSLHPWD